MSALPPPEFWHTVDLPVLEALATLLALINTRAIEAATSVQIALTVDDDGATLILTMPCEVPRSSGPSEESA